MTEAYNPLKDPTSDGYAKVELSKTDWKTGKTEPAVFDNPTFIKWFKRGAWLFLVGLIFVVGTLAWKANKAHKAEIAKIESTPVALPPLIQPAKEKKRKAATKTEADKASNTTATAEFMPEFKAAKPIVNDSFTSEFEQKLAEFERKIPK